MIAGCIERLRRNCDILVIEGAGSPAEINLRERDLVNMFVAKTADAPVLLVGDIDRGGVFAALVGTMELLLPEERERVAAFVINKFRGDLTLLKPGLDFLEERTKIPVLGVIPYVPRLYLADEDSVALDDRTRVGGAIDRRGKLDIAVVRFPRISNHDDFLPLEHTRDAGVRFVEHPAEVAGADLVILPGSKSTMSDLDWLNRSGLAREIEARAGRGEPVLGVCGGCQMLGRSILDAGAVESVVPHMRGLGLLPVVTRFEKMKVTAQVRAHPAAPCFLTQGLSRDDALDGYEIHMGGVELDAGAVAPFAIERRNAPSHGLLDGAVSAEGAVVGTMLHGLFENESVREALLRYLWARRGSERPTVRPPVPTRDAAYDRLADAVRASLDPAMLRRIARIPRVRG